MSYLVIARKYRPQTFQSVVGQAHITKALANAVLRDQVPHALLLTGPRGVGKTTTARIFAKSLNCTGRDQDIDFGNFDEENARQLVEPCGECVNCKEISKSTSLAVWEVDGASHNSVDNVRDLIDSLRTQPPPGSAYKVYIIDEVHMLSVAAFNALLKSLEEPPANTVFVFATTEPHKIPDTVISRCQRHDFRRLPTSLIVEQLKQIAATEKIVVDEDVLQFIARRAQGGMRDSQSMLDRLLAFSDEGITIDLAEQVFGVVGRDFFIKITQAIFSEDTASCFEILDSIFTRSVDIRQFSSDFISYWRNLLLLGLSRNSKSRPDASKEAAMLELSTTEHAEMISLLEGKESFDLQRLFDIAHETVQSALQSNHPRFVYEAGVGKMATLPSLRPLPELIKLVREGCSSGVLPSATSPIASRVKINRPSAPVVEQSATPIPNDTAEELEPEPEVVIEQARFNPSWEDFLNHVKSRKEVRLLSHLRRVRVVTFVSNRLIVEGTSFDITSLKETSSLKKVNEFLHSYSGQEKWNVEFKEIVDPGKVVRDTGGVKPAPRSISAEAAYGSVASREASDKKKLRAKIEKEAKEQPSVKAALSAFEGSKIEVVSVLKN